MGMHAAVDGNDLAGQIAVAALGHGRGDPLGEQKRSAQVDGQRGVEVGHRHLVQGLHPAEPRIGDQHIDCAELRLGVVDKPRGRPGLAQVGADGHRPSVRSLDALGQGPRGGLVAAVAEGDGGSGSGQALGDRGPDASAGPGDEGDLAREGLGVEHRSPFCTGTTGAGNMTAISDLASIPTAQP
jgi:hypothetical protein